MPDSCLISGFIDSKTGLCVWNCPLDSFVNTTTRICYYQNSLNTENCSLGQQSIDILVAGKCVDDCDVNYLISSDHK